MAEDERPPGGASDRSDDSLDAQDPFNLDRIQDIIAQAAERGIDVRGLSEEDIQQEIERYDREALAAARRGETVVMERGVARAAKQDAKSMKRRAMKAAGRAGDAAARTGARKAGRRAGLQKARTAAAPTRKVATRVSGRSKTTTRHDVIQRWAEERGGNPAKARGTRTELQISFPGYTTEAIEHVSWNEFFRTFESDGLEMTYEEKTPSGRQSRSARFVGREQGKS